MQSSLAQRGIGVPARSQSLECGMSSAIFGALGRGRYGSPWTVMGVRYIVCWSYAPARVDDFSNNSLERASVRDRGVGGSYSLAPTKIFKKFHRITGTSARFLPSHPIVPNCARLDILSKKSKNNLTDRHPLQRGFSSSGAKSYAGLMLAPAGGPRSSTIHRCASSPARPSQLPPKRKVAVARCLRAAPATERPSRSVKFDPLYSPRKIYFTL